jgi:hypothetical protein
VLEVVLGHPEGLVAQPVRRLRVAAAADSNDSISRALG